jgi:predicted acetyltransferase
MTDSADAPYPIRPVNADEWEAVLAHDQLAFGDVFPEEVTERERNLLSWSRTLGAYDGDELVGFTAAFELAMRVPGGLLPRTSGVTWVSVRPTHRRRGVLSSLIRRQLIDLYELGEPVATLWASEPVIYGRYGFGLAATRYSLKVPRRAELVDAPTDPELRLQLVDPKKALDALERIDSAAPARPGSLRRDERWWSRSTDDTPGSRGGGKLYCVLAESAGQPRGYALYTPRAKWESGGPAGTVDVREVVGADSAAYAELWRFLLDIDLMAKVEYWNLPVDDPLLWWLADSRRTEPTLSDSMYVRLLDVGTALSARRYSTGVDVVIELTDDVCGWNAGRWHLTGGGAEASATKTSTAADIRLDARTLGSIYLGGVSLNTLAAAGRVEELRSGAVTAAGRAFTHSPAPWCQFVF